MNVRKPVCIGAALAVALSASAVLAQGPGQGQQGNVAGTAVGTTGIVTDAPSVPTANAATAVSKGKLKVGKKTYRITWAGTKAAKAFRTYVKKPRKLAMSELNGNEKYHYFSNRTFPMSEKTPATIKAGDVMLYGDDCVVVFYKTHANDGYSYTKLGRLTSTKGLAKAVGSGSVRVTFSR